VDTGVLVTGYIGFHRIPAKQGERLVEIGGAGEVRDEKVFQAAVPQPNGDVREWNSRLGGWRHAIVVVVNKCPRVKVCLPLRGRDVTHFEVSAASQTHWGRKTIHELVVPLVKGGQSPIA